MKVNKEVKILSIVTLVVLVISYAIYFIASRDKNAKREARPALSTSIESFSVGPNDAKVTVVEYFDPECETCAQISPYIKNEIKYYNGKVKWVFRYMAYHPNSRNAILILEASRNQNLYLEVMTLLFKRQNEWGAKHDGTDQNQSKLNELLNIVSSLSSLNLQKLKNDMKNSAIDTLIENDRKDGVAAGVTGTPTLFVNGKIIAPLSLDEMIKRIDAGLK